LPIGFLLFETRTDKNAVLLRTALPPHVGQAFLPVRVLIS
jgi:hypothetical protein